jgi:hypothetical protein
MEQTMTVKKSGQNVYNLQKSYVEPPQDVDKEMAIRKLKIENATGHDQTPAELIKEGGQEIRKVI